ncbi:unnamed protein product [Ilex paraguariensis]|uniref:Uncharacterized protein n=1 Tax=Ilex paraguariensis TaxID=185542 RepID=A0ABC8TX91_9AQUA
MKDRLELTPSEELKVTRIEKCKTRTFKELVTSKNLAKYNLGPLVFEKPPASSRSTSSEDEDFPLAVYQDPIVMSLTFSLFLLLIYVSPRTLPFCLSQTLNLWRPN